LIRLSRKFGTAVAIAAGLDAVIGDFIVVMLPAADPPRLIPQLVQRAREGAGIIFGVRRGRASEPLLMRIGAAAFYWYCARILKLNVPPRSALYRVLSRQAVNAITQIRGKRRDLRILCAQVGFVTESFLYDPLNRAGRPKRKGFFEAVNSAIDVIVTSSRHPLRLVSWLGIFASILNIAYSVYVISIYLFKEDVQKGWTTLSLQNAAMFFFLFLILTVLSEYIGHILVEAEERPTYYVLEERTSSVLIADQERRNVVKDSIAEKLPTCPPKE
jgi:glycosyltransferase involved in cell wall biosynthesis